MATKKYLDWDGLVELVSKLKEKYGECFHWEGVVANVAALPTISGLTVDDVGSVYNITTAGKTTSDFVEGAGKALPANSNVVLSNLGTEQSPVLKWDVIGVFDISDKLTFGTTFPASPSDGDTFLYTGATTYEYTAVTPEGTENPQEEGWYVSDGTTYTLTSDTTVQSGTTYYTRTEQYLQGVVYQYDSTASEWNALSSGDTMIAITTAEVDSLFE